VDQTRPIVQRLLNSARACAKRNRFNQFHKILKPLIRQENPEALFLAGRFSRPRETGDKHERRYIDYIQRAAAKEYPPALYILGFYYDMGDAVPVISHDQINAAQIFKRGAELKHAQPTANICTRRLCSGVFPRNQNRHSSGTGLLASVR